MPLVRSYQTSPRRHEPDVAAARAHGRSRWLDALWSELRQAARGLRASPALSASVVLTFALGLGAASVVHGTLRRLLLQPPPHVAAPEQLVRPYFHYGMRGAPPRAFDRLSYPFLEQLRERGTGIEAAAAYEPDVPLLVGTGAEARAARATLVSPGFWRTVGTPPHLGRFFADEEAHPTSGARVVVLGHLFWRRRFRGDRSVVGATLHVRGAPYRIVGVAPRGFRGVELVDTDLWLPLAAAVDVAGRPAGWHTAQAAAWVKFVVRTTPGTPAAGTAAALTRLHAVLIGAAEGSEAVEAIVGRPTTHVTLERVTRPIDSRGRRLPQATATLWLVVVAALLLAIAAANVAGLLLLRALRRRHEIGVRLALGMSRRRLAAMLFTEAALLALLGGAAAAALTIWGGEAVRRTLLPGMVGEGAGVDWQSVATITAVAAGATVLTGLAPVVQTRPDLTANLRAGGQHGATGRSALYTTLLVAQTALSAVLLVGAGLFLRSLHRAASMDLGFDPTHTLVVSLEHAASGRPLRATASVLERALERIRALPGVQSASLATGAPLRRMSIVPLRTAPGGEVVSSAGSMSMGFQVADGFVESAGLRLVAGRGITASDRDGPPVAVVTESLARLAWPGRSPLGECAYLGMEAADCVRVVGIVGDFRTIRQRERPALGVFTPLSRAGDEERVLVVRALPGVRGVDAAVERLLRDLEPNLLHVDADWLADALDPEIRPWRLGAAVFTTFGALAAVLAAFGLHAAVAYAAAQRTREIGVRVAMGARPATIAGLVVADALRTSAVGIAAGLVLALAGGRWVGDLLFDTSARDPLVFTAVGAALLLAGATASLVPARRATRVSPMEALRGG